MGDPEALREAITTLGSAQAPDFLHIFFGELCCIAAHTSVVGAVQNLVGVIARPTFPSEMTWVYTAFVAAPAGMGGVISFVLGSPVDKFAHSPMCAG